MKLSGIVLAISMAASGLNAAPIIYSATLTGANENPAVSTAGNGYATVIIDSMANTMQVIVEFYGLSGPNTAAHIHCCVTVPNGTAGVASATPTFPGFPTGSSGFYNQTFDTLALSTYRAGFVTGNGGTAASAQAALFAGITNGLAYLNIHTAANPGGEIRGFLVPAPEPATMAMSGLALGLVAILRRRRGRG